MAVNKLGRKDRALIISIISNFEYNTREIRNITYISYYDLYKVARFLGLEFERTKAAPYVYKELIDRDQVKIVTENHRTFITFTQKGRKSCKEKLEELQVLDEHFNITPSAEQRYKEGWKESLVKGQ